MAKAKKRGSFNRTRIYELFKQSLNYIFESKNYIFFAIFLFLFSILLGLIFPKLFEEQLLKLIKDLLDQTKGLDIFEMIGFIMFNNIKSSFFGLFFGLFFGILPIVLITVNGFLLGFVINRVVSSENVFVLWKLFPHGVFEIPAILISVGIGLRLGLFFINIKNRVKGFAFFVLSFVGFSFLFSLFSIIFSLFYHINSMDISNSSLLNLNSLYFFFVPLCFVLSSYWSLYIFNKKERTFIIMDFFSEIKKGIIVFVFLVIPLLVLAGIIEGSLISLIK